MELTNAIKAAFASLDNVTSLSGKYSVLSGGNAVTLSGSSVTVDSSDEGKFKGVLKLADINIKDDAVDLGLPSGTLWASKNIGAARETDWGMYFSWGNVDAHQAGAGYNFSQDVYNATAGNSLTTDITINYDAAKALLGGKWKMPTMAQFQELCNSSYTEYIDPDGTVKTGTDKRTTYNGVVGLLFRSKINSNRLFFPAAGYYNGTSLDYRGSRGGYWSSTWVSATNARDLYFDSGGVYPQGNGDRRYGFSVRAVQN